MPLQAFLWMVLPLFVAGGSALLAYYVMQSRMEVALAKERESLAEVRATLQSAKVTMEERIKATEESTRRAAFEEFMQDIRIEERSYVRDTNSASGARRSMVLQERVFFRNIPMSAWNEREMLIEEGAKLSDRPVNFDPTMIATGFSPNPAALGTAPQFHAPVPTPAVPQAREPRVEMPKMIDPVAHKPAPARRETRTLVAAFGAQ